MRWLRGAAVLIGLWAAYLVLFVVGAAALGPGGDRDPSERTVALSMMLVVAGLDAALLATWISRARSTGWRLWLEAAVVLYGIKTFSSTLEVWWFVRQAFIPREMLPNLFLMTLPLAIGWSGLAAWALGPREPEARPIGERTGLDLAVRAGLAGALLYPALFFLAGYYVAWQDPAVRAYYGGPAVALPFPEHFRQLVAGDPLVIPFEMARGLLWVAIGWPVLRGTRGPWWVGGLLFAAMLAVLQNDMHLLPNPLMPREVRVWHLIETASSNAVFGLATAALLAPPLGFAEVWQSARRGAWSRTADRRFAAASAALLVLLAVGGLYGGSLLFFDPTGGLLQLDPRFLASTPFRDYEVPGVVLVLANGVLPLIAAAAVLAHSRRAPWWVAASGVVLLGWMTFQLAWLGWLFWLQGALIAWGLALVGVAAAWLAADRAVPAGP